MVFLRRACAGVLDTAPYPCAMLRDAYAVFVSAEWLSPPNCVYAAYRLDAKVLAIVARLAATISLHDCEFCWGRRGARLHGDFGPGRCILANPIAISLVAFPVCVVRHLVCACGRARAQERRFSALRTSIVRLLCVCYSAPLLSIRRASG